MRAPIPLQLRGYCSPCTRSPRTIEEVVMAHDDVGVSWKVGFQRDFAHRVTSNFPLPCATSTFPLFQQIAIRADAAIATLPSSSNRIDLAVRRVALPSETKQPVVAVAKRPPSPHSFCSSPSSHLRRPLSFGGLLVGPKAIRTAPLFAFPQLVD